MRRTSFIVAFAAIVLSFGLAYGGLGSMSLDHVDNNFSYAGPVTVGDTIKAGYQISFWIRWTNDCGANIRGASNGFRVYSADAQWYKTDGGAGGFTWVPYLDLTTIPPTLYVVYPGWQYLFDNSLDQNPYGVDGIGADTIGFAGSQKYGGGVPDGFSEVVYKISFFVDVADSNETLCLDSSFYPPTNEWLWSSDTLDPTNPGTGDIFPAWGGPYCFTIFKVPNLPPEITNCSPLPSFDHCLLATYDFNASDPESDPFTFHMASGPGIIDANTGEWSYQPTLGDVSASLSIGVYADDGQPGGTCNLSLSFTNQAPTFASGCGQTVVKSGGETATATLKGNKVDCDPFTMSITNVTPTPVGGYSIDDIGGGFWTITFLTDATDGGNYYDFTVEITDGNLSNTCHVFFDIVIGAPIKIAMPFCDGDDVAYQGMHYYLPVDMVKSAYPIGGFNILIAYDASVLSFQKAIEGPDFYVPGCGWEYFTYRYGPDGNCGNACPSGLLRVVGIAETNNGDNHPDCFTPDPLPATMFTLDFLVSNDRTFECQCIPVRFFWTKCDDNSLSSDDGNKLYISAGVFDGAFPDVDIHKVDVGYPTYLGAQDEDCFVGDRDKVPFREIDFVNGGIQIACADSIDVRGDINLNEIPYEIADAVLFSNYFVYGIGVFTKNLQGQIAASDVNADGIALSVADLVYLIRVVVGDALPYPKLNPVLTSYSVSANGTINVEGEMGAAAITVAGDVVPTLHATNMEMKYSSDGLNTRILVWSTEANETFSGAFITVNGNVTSLEMATYEGAPVVAKETLPSDFGLSQNYPNPFNPATVIEMALPVASDYTLTIYNVTGQEVASFSGHADAGSHSITWNAVNEASGIYFYKLDAGNFTATKKMVLLK